MSEDAVIVVQPGSYRVTYRGVAVEDEVTQSQVTINEQVLMNELLDRAEAKLAPAFRGDVRVSRIDLWTDQGWVEI